VSTLDAELSRIFALLDRGERAHALGALEAARAAVDARGDARTQATFHQTLAGVLDESGRHEEALAEALRALALDREHWPDSPGALLSLRSVILILQSLGRDDEVRDYVDEMWAIGQRLGGVPLAEAASMFASELFRRDEHAAAKPVLERARFACDVVLREDRPAGRALGQLARLYADVVAPLGALHARDGDPDRAELVHGPAAALLAPFVPAEPACRARLATVWEQLASHARRRGSTREARLLVRHAIFVLDGHEATRASAARERCARALAKEGSLGPDDPAPLDVFRVLRWSNEPRADRVVVAHPLCGWFTGPASDLAPAPRAFGEIVDVTIDDGRLAALTVRQSPSS
jgi:tetratricopeptide (TPR) repeat protein